MIPKDIPAVQACTRPAATHLRSSGAANLQTELAPWLARAVAAPASMPILDTVPRGPKCKQSNNYHLQMPWKCKASKIIKCNTHL